MREVVTHEEIRAASNETPYVLIKFGATWCGPCNALQPLLDGWEDKPEEVTLLAVDADAAEPLLDLYNIRRLPTVVLMKGTQVVSRLQTSDFAKIRREVEEVVRSNGDEQF